MHTIQLRGPWQYQLLSEAPNSTGQVMDEGRLNLPTDWATVVAGTPQRARFLRRFNRPTGIASGDRVDLVVEGLTLFVEVRLNDRLLVAIDGAAGGIRFDISQALQSRNQVVIELQLDPKRQYFGQVGLEIHSGCRHER